MEQSMALPKDEPIAVDPQSYYDEGTELIARYIKPHPSKRGREHAVVVDGPSVAAIIRALLGGVGDYAAVAASWAVPTDAVRAAVIFYQRNRAFFDARMLLEDDEWNPEFGGARGQPLS
jgi:hypothetical protein